MSYLKRDTGKLSSGLGHHQLLLAATVFGVQWCMGNSVVEDIFLDDESRGLCAPRPAQGKGYGLNYKTVLVCVWVGGSVSCKCG